MTALAATPIQNLSARNLQALAAWYRKLADTLQGHEQAVALQRIERYLHGYLMADRTDDPNRAKVAEELQKVEEQVDRLSRRFGTARVPLRWVDVSKLVDPKKHQMQYASLPWQKKGSQLSHTGFERVIRIPVEPLGDYRFRIKFKRAADTNLKTHLPIITHAVPFGVRPNSTGFFTYLGSGQPLITPNKDHQLDFTVRQTDKEVQLFVDLDEKPYFKWTGPRSRLQRSTFLLPPPQTFTLGSGGAGVVFYGAYLKMLSGTARMIP